MTTIVQVMFDFSFLVSEVLVSRQFPSHVFELHASSIYSSFLEDLQQAFWNSDGKHHCVAFSPPDRIPHGRLLSTGFDVNFIYIEGIFSIRSVTTAVIKNPDKCVTLVTRVLDLCNQGCIFNLGETIPTFSDYESDEDSSFDPEGEEYDEVSSVHVYAQEWVESLSRDDLLSLSILLWYLLVNILEFQLTEAAKLIARVLGKSDRTIREWKAVFRDNDGCFPDSLQGKYQREGVLWQNEELNKIATKYVRENTVVKGRPNMTAISFCQWSMSIYFRITFLIQGIHAR